MKYKILFIIIISTILTFLIYFHTKQDKITLLSLGDGISTGMTIYHVEGYDYNDYLSNYLNTDNNLANYYKNFNEVDETTTSLLTKINHNITNINQKIKLKQAIKNADIITISLGMDELNNYAKKNNLGSTKITGFLNKYNELLTTITKLNHKKIYLLSLYSTNLIPRNKITKINAELKKLAETHHLTYIDISNITENQTFFSQKNNYYPNYKGQEYIYFQIKSTFDKTTFFII